MSIYNNWSCNLLWFIEIEDDIKCEFEWDNSEQIFSLEFLYLF